MTPREMFEEWVAEEFPNAVPEKFHHLIKNVAFLVEDEPSPELRKEEGLGPQDTLLGHYRGVPHTVRGSSYGIGNVLPDTIILFQKPIEEEARHLLEQQIATEESAPGRSAKSNSLQQQFAALVRRVIRETIWHEVAHYFGMDEWQVRDREAKRDI